MRQKLKIWNLLISQLNGPYDIAPHRLVLSWLAIHERLNNPASTTRSQPPQLVIDLIEHMRRMKCWVNWHEEMNILVSLQEITFNCYSWECDLNLWVSQAEAGVSATAATEPTLSSSATIETRLPLCVKDNERYENTCATRINHVARLYRRIRFSMAFPSPSIFGVLISNRKAKHI